MSDPGPHGPLLYYNIVIIPWWKLCRINEFSPYLCFLIPLQHRSIEKALIQNLFKWKMSPFAWIFSTLFSNFSFIYRVYQILTKCLSRLLLICCVRVNHLVDFVLVSWWDTPRDHFCYLLFRPSADIYSLLTLLISSAFFFFVFVSILSLNHMF